MGKGESRLSALAASFCLLWVCKPLGKLNISSADTSPTIQAQQVRILVYSLRLFYISHFSFQWASLPSSSSRFRRSPEDENEKLFLIGKAVLWCRLSEFMDGVMIVDLDLHGPYITCYNSVPSPFSYLSYPFLTGNPHLQWCCWRSPPLSPAQQLQEGSSSSPEPFNPRLFAPRISLGQTIPRAKRHVRL